ncbi:hypothetical protein A4G29_06580 [Mycobacterium kansasii]|nr:hypothetical protein A4G29_06580 [Mycobacterium kansasii]
MIVYCAALVAVFLAQFRKVPSIAEGICEDPNSSSRYRITAAIPLGSRSATVPYGIAVDPG